MSELECRFLSDAQVRADFGHYDYVTAEYVSPLTPHTTLANSLLLDPDSATDLGFCPLTVTETTLTKNAAQQSAQDVRAEASHSMARDKAQRTQLIVLPPEGDEPHSNITFSVFEYSVAVAYKVVGRLRQLASDGQRQYCVRVVWEPRRFALAQGTILAPNGKLRQRDQMIVSAVQQFQDKVAEKDGDPLPIAEALAGVVMHNREKSAVISDDVRALLSSNEVKVDISVVHVTEKSVKDQLTEVLEHTLQQMGVQSESPEKPHEKALRKDANDADNGDDGGDDDLPALVHEDDETME